MSQDIEKNWKPNIFLKYREKIRSAVPRYRWVRAVYRWVRAVCGWGNAIIELLLVWKAQQNYRKKIRELSKSTEKIKVVFLVSECAAWNGDSLYKLLEADARFSPIVLFAPVTQNVKYKGDNFSINCQFFLTRGYNFAAIFSGADFRKHKPDIVFYQQRSGIADRYGLKQISVSRYALCLYFHYGIAANIDHQGTWDFGRFFYKMLYRNFVFNTVVVEQFNAKGVYNTIVTGHPKMDVYLEPVKTNPWKDKKKFKIVFAPHHSFREGTTQWATFGWNGRELLEWAKAHTSTEWVFKPHPAFRKFAIMENIMNEAEMDKYYDEWDKIGTVYEQGDYFDMFRTADLLITDCGSFLTEWLPTEKPCIHLITNNEAQKARSPVHENSSRHYYKVKNIEELEVTMEMLVVRREDPLAEARIQDAKTVPLDCAKNIHQWLVETIWGEKREATEPQS